MTSFIELPRLTFDGRPRASIYVNTADIVCLGDTDYAGQVNVTIRELGSEGVGIVQTYVPFQYLLDALNEMASRPGVRSWADSVKEAWAPPVTRILAEAFHRERDGWRQGVS